MKIFQLCAMALSLSACTFTHPVKGVVENKAHERFLGTATASLLEDNASIDITTDTGATCSGVYPRPKSTGGGVSASGKFTCSDGRVGHFTFSGTMHGGDGFGKLNNGQKFIFKYGDSGSAADDAAMIAALGAAGQAAQATQPVVISAPSQPQLISLPHPVHCSSSSSYLGTTVHTDCY